MPSWRSRLAVLAVLAVWLLAPTACKKEGDLPPEFGTDRPAIDVDKLKVPSLFAHVPADTPYVLATFEAMPVDYMAKWKRALGPAFGRVFDQARPQMANTTAGRWLDAIIGELAGKWSVKGLEEIGLSSRPRFAIYGHGAAPAVLRLEVKDTTAMLATVQRIADRAGEKLPAPESRHGGQFWRIELPGENGLIVALSGGHLVVAVGPRHAIAAVLPQLVGSEKPARNMGDGKQLKELVARHRFGTQMIGYVDFKRLVKALIALSEKAPPKDCAAELGRIATLAPRLVIGDTELSTKRYAGGMVLELAPSVVEQLKGLRTAVPGLSAALADDPVFALGVGMDLTRGKAVGKAFANVLRDLGEACEATDLVRSARNLREVMSESLPGPLAKLAGGAISIDSIEFPKSRRSGRLVPRAADGFAMLASSAPKDVYEELRDEIPELGRLRVKADGKLHEIYGEDFGLAFDLLGGVGAEVLAVSAGSRGKRRAEKALAATGGGKAPLVVGSFDLGWIYELQIRLAQPDEVQREVNERMSDLYGRTTVTLDATDAGLALWYSTELK